MNTNGSPDAKPLGGSDQPSKDPTPLHPPEKPLTTPSSSSPSSQKPVPIQPATESNQSTSKKPAPESKLGSTGETQDKWKNATAGDNDFKSHENREEPKKDHHESMEDKVRDTFRNMRDSKKVDELYSYAQNNKEQTMIYVLLIVGLLVLFFNYILGGLIIGMVAGYYFADEIVYYIRNLGQIINGHDQLRYVILSAVLLGLFISAPGIFIGAAIVAAFKHVMGRKD